MHLLVYGPGRLGQAIATAAKADGWAATFVNRRPGGASVPPPMADVVVDASAGSDILTNLDHALAAGNRSLVLATTGWAADPSTINDRLVAAGAAAVVAPNLSLGAALFLRVVTAAARWYGSLGDFEPSIVEWHRAGKSDRPSGTARALAQGIAAADRRWVVETADVGCGPGRRPLEVASIRAGAAPGTHAVTFDAPGESVEIRLTARDRSAYAAGALAAARWLVDRPRPSGLHSFDAVVDDLIQPRSPAVLP